MHRILFVCSGNICRSPTAEGVARYWIEAYGLSQVVAVDSAGTGATTSARRRTRGRKAAKRRGYDLSRLRPASWWRRTTQKFDLLLAMDEGHLQIMRRQCPAGACGQACPPDGFSRSSHPRLKCPTLLWRRGRVRRGAGSCEAGVKGLARALQGRTWSGLIAPRKRMKRPARGWPFSGRSPCGPTWCRSEPVAVLRFRRSGAGATPSELGRGLGFDGATVASLSGLVSTICRPISSGAPRSIIC